MKRLLKSWLVRALGLMMAASVAFAVERGPYRQEELGQMLAPVALYPDSLLAQILVAATHSRQVTEASGWSRANPGLTGQDALRAVEQMDWDPSVKALVAFPQVLSMMGEKIEWTERLGEAFRAQEAEVMDAVQGLRRRAEAAGSLRSDDRMSVTRQGEAIAIQPAAPEVVHVPYYDPALAYGPWPWSAYPPFYWTPWPRHYVYPAYGTVFFWSTGIVVPSNFFFCRPDWRRRRVNVVRNPATVVNQPPVVNRVAAPPATRSGLQPAARETAATANAPAPSRQGTSEARRIRDESDRNERGRFGGRIRGRD